MGLFSMFKDNDDKVKPYTDKGWTDVISVEQIGLYQRMINKLLSQTKLKAHDDYLQGREFAKEIMDQEEQILREIYKEGKEEYGLQGKAMQIMITQYILADVWMRDINKDKWVMTVLYRDDTDFFPNFFQTWDTLDKFYS